MKQFIAAYAGLLIVISAIVNAGLYLYLASNPFVWKDDFFFVYKFLIPFSEGDFEFCDLFVLRNHADHLQVLHRLFFFLNAKLFSLDMKIEALAGFVFLVGCYYLLYSEYKASVERSKSRKLFVFLGMVLISLLCFSFNSTTQYEWPLVTFGFVNSFLVITGFLLVSRFMTTGKRSQAHIFLFYYPLLLFCADDMALLAFMAIFCVLGVYVVFVQRLPFAITFLICMFIETVLYVCWKSEIVTILNTNTQFVVLESISHSIGQPWSAFSSLLLGLSSGVVSAEQLRVLAEDKRQVFMLVVGIGTLLLYMQSFYYVFKYELYKKTVVPIFLMFFTLFILLGILVYRVPVFGQNIVLVPRYVVGLQYGFIGCVWIILLRHSLLELPLYSMQWFRNHIPLMMLCCVITVSSCVYIKAGWVRYPSVVRYFQNQGANLLQVGATLSDHNDSSQIDYPTLSCGDITEKCYSDTILFLQRNNLNVFSSRYPVNIIMREERKP